MLTITDEIVALDAHAVRASVALVSRARGRDMSRPTPCPDWTLHGLLAHMTAQHYGFAAASVGDSALARWRTRRLGRDPVADYQAAADTVLAAFAADGVLDRRFPLAEFDGSPVFPARQAISFHFVDYVVHSWDVAKALGVEAEFPTDVLEVALRVALAVPDGNNRLAPGAAFALSLTVGGGSPLDLIVAILGRDPGWKRPVLPAHGRCWPRKVSSAWLNWAAASRLGRCPAPSMATSCGRFRLATISAVTAAVDHGSAVPATTRAGMSRAASIGR
jgi:uncharacterized protein (TIGR03086 family)